MVVSWISACAAEGLPRTCPSRRARASCSRRRPRWRSRISPARMARAAAPTASRPEAQSRFRVVPGTSLGSPASSSGHARDVAVVLARLVGAAVEHLVELRPVGLGIARHQRLDRQRREIVGADLGERPGDSGRWASGSPSQRNTSRVMLRLRGLSWCGPGCRAALRDFSTVGSGLSCVPTFCDMPTGGQASCTGVGKRTCRADLPCGLAEQTCRADLAAYPGRPAKPGLNGKGAGSSRRAAAPAPKLSP